MEFLKAISGNGIFFLGTLLGIIIQELVPTFINILGTEQQGIISLGIILMWIIALIVVPTGYFIWGLTSEKEDIPPFFKAMASIILALFTLALLYYGWFIVTAMYGFISDTTLRICYWAGLIICLAFDIVIIPVVTIAKKN